MRETARKEWIISLVPSSRWQLPKASPPAPTLFHSTGPHAVLSLQEVEQVGLRVSRGRGDRQLLKIHGDVTSPSLCHINAFVAALHL